MTVPDNLRLALSAIIDIVAAYVVLNVGYSLWLLLVALIAKVISVKPPAPQQPTTRFCVLIPAHNEEVVISQTLLSFGKLDYPPELLKVVVIADNCTDRTAVTASEFEFVTVLQRCNLAEKGKGYALNWAVLQLADEDNIDCFAIVDSDTVVEPDFFRQMDARKRVSEKGAFAAQGRYDVANPNESWRTGLMAGALCLVHVVRPAARELLGLTVGLKGNGMCFDRNLLISLPWRGDSLTEDIDYTLDLLEQFNVRVAFVGNAHVAAIMPTASSAAASQRKRWENGRSAIIKRRSAKLLLKGILGFNPTYFDAALDLLALPLAQLAFALTFWILLILASVVIGGAWRFQAILAGCSVVSLFAYIVIGFYVGNAPSLAYRSLFYAPFYTVWKLILRTKKPSQQDSEWVRTDRELLEPAISASVQPSDPVENSVNRII